MAVEVVLIGGGNWLLAAVGHPDYDAAWTLFVVGVIFVPLARIFHAGALASVGVVVAVVAVAAAYLGLASYLAPSAAAGAGAGLVFIGYAAWVLGRGPHAPRCVGDARETPSLPSRRRLAMHAPGARATPDELRRQPLADM